MHLDLIDHLRCPRAHDESVLVASIDRVVDRDISEGSLGCPVCLVQYPIRGFVADFTGGPSPSPSVGSAAEPRGDDAITRAAAMLDARAPGAWHLLFGAWGMLGAALAVSFDVHVVILNPPAGAPLAEGVSMLEVAADRLPFARAWAAGAALDLAASQLPSFVEGAVHALRTGARLVAPAALRLPNEVRELARDQSWWVAERDAPAGRPIPLQRVNR